MKTVIFEGKMIRLNVKTADCGHVAPPLMIFKVNGTDFCVQCYKMIDPSRLVQ